MNTITAQNVTPFNSSALHQFYVFWMFATLMLIPISTSISTIFYFILCLSACYQITRQQRWSQLLSHPITPVFWSGAVLILLGIFYSSSSWAITLSTAQKYLWLLMTPLLLISINGDLSLKKKQMSYSLYLMMITFTLLLSFYRIYTLPNYFSANSNLQLNIIFKDHIIQSLMFVFALYLCLYRLFIEKISSKILLTILSITLTINLLFINDGRIGYLLLMLGGIYFIYSQLELKKAILLSIISIIALSIVMTVSPILQRRVSDLLEHVKHYQQDPMWYSSVSARVNNWKIGFNLFKQAPVFGHGTGGIYQSYKQYIIEHKLPYDDILSGSVSSFSRKHRRTCDTSINKLCPDKLLDSSYLNFALQYGLLGIAFCLYLLMGLWRLSKTLHPLDRYMARIILLCYIVGLWLNPWLSSSAPTHLVSVLFAFIYAKPLCEKTLSEIKGT